MQRLLIIAILYFIQVPIFAQVDTTDWSLEYAKYVDKADLQRYLMILSSDEYEGRETAKDGANKAAQYIAAQFKNFRLPEYATGKGYFQTVPFQRNAWTEINLKVNGTEYKHMADYVSLLPYNYNRKATTFDEIIFCGYGIADKKYTDYKSVDVRGKAVLIYKGEPQKDNGKYVISGGHEPSVWSTEIGYKLKAAKNAGAALVLIIDNEVSKIAGDNRKFLIDGRIRLHDGTIRQKKDIVNNAYITPGVAEAIMGEQREEIIKARDKINDKGKSSGKGIAISTKIEITHSKQGDLLRSHNILGYLEGSDPELKNEIVILSAHYDHLGVKGEKIFNGANDNGSGTSTIIDLMQAFSLAKRNGHGPKRSILALLVTGEEKGLLGSKYYCKTPAFPLENTIVDVNVDMVGRTDKLHDANDRYIYVIGADKLSQDLHEINETANATYTQMDLDYRYNDENDPNRYYYRSDHYNFVKNGIPAIFYFNGVHEDYHRSTDTVDKIDFDLLEQTAKLIFHTTWELANRPERIKIDEDKMPKE